MANRFAAEAYQVGDANMEFDATLDQMTIDADHENALGMESVDVGAMKNAALSAQFGMQGAVDTSGGIDIDGDGVIDVGGGAGAGAMMKFSEKFEIVHIPLGKSMGPSGDPTCDIPDFAPQANGIIPGYAGHIPRARDKYGGAAHGGCSIEIHGQKHIGAQMLHEKADALGNRYGNDGLPLPPKAVEPVFDNYKTKVQGVMPGCTPPLFRSARLSAPAHTRIVTLSSRSLMLSLSRSLSPSRRRRLPPWRARRVRRRLLWRHQTLWRVRPPRISLSHKADICGYRDGCPARLHRICTNRQADARREPLRQPLWRPPRFATGGRPARPRECEGRPLH